MIVYEVFLLYILFIIQNNQLASQHDHSHHPRPLQRRYLCQYSAHRKRVDLLLGETGAIIFQIASDPIKKGGYQSEPVDLGSRSITLNVNFPGDFSQACSEAFELGLNFDPNSLILQFLRHVFDTWPPMSSCSDQLSAMVPSILVTLSSLLEESYKDW